MRKKILPVAVTTVCALLLVGCHKEAAVSAVPASTQTFNAVQYCKDFASASPEIQKLSDQAWRSVQSGAFRDALKCLHQLSVNPALNEAQKKSTADLTQQVEKEMARAAAGQ
ncbi:MAG TPA: hypothetical protein VF988_16690 [Verrucomicrobiae bacterium]